MREFTFNKETDNKWYVVLPEWEGSKADLEMVCGADTMLDIISQGENKVEITISEEFVENALYELTFDKEESDGGWYDVKSDFFEFKVWLCYVTKFVYGYLPEKLYIL